MTPTKQQTQSWLPSIFNDFFGNEWITKNRSTVPAVNIMEDEKRYTVEVAVPGLKKEDINIRIDDNSHLIITVDTKKEKEEETQKGKYIRREFSCSQFRQTLLLPENIDEEEIEAKQENGLLTIHIPKKKTVENTEPKKYKSNNVRGYQGKGCFQNESTLLYFHTTPCIIFFLASAG